MVALTFQDKNYTHWFDLISRNKKVHLEPAVGKEAHLFDS